MAAGIIFLFAGCVWFFAATIQASFSRKISAISILVGLVQIGCGAALIILEATQ